MKPIYKVFICIFFILVHCNESAAQSTIKFSGITWNVRSGGGDPGPNNWSSSTDNVWVDSLGQLHMKIRKAGNNWYCSEIYSQRSFGYGEYRFYVSSDVENYDPQIVVGLFTYENDSREIDIEFSRWEDTASLDGWYTVQPPPYSINNQDSFALNLKGNYSTHKFIWSKDSIFFQSYRGHYSTLPSPDSLINQWSYSGEKNPPAGNERVHINFWLFGGKVPIDRKEAELIISTVYVPNG